MCIVMYSDKSNLSVMFGSLGLH